MKRTVNPKAIEIQKRFFEAIDVLVASNKCGGLQPFCKQFNLNRVKYASLRSDLRHPNEDKVASYKSIDIDALAGICEEYGVSSDWILLNKGTMFNAK